MSRVYLVNVWHQLHPMKEGFSQKAQKPVDIFKTTKVQRLQEVQRYCINIFPLICLILLTYNLHSTVDRRTISGKQVLLFHR